MNEGWRHARLAAMGVVLWRPRKVGGEDSSAKLPVTSMPLVAALQASSVEDDSFGPMHDADAQPPERVFTAPFLELGTAYDDGLASAAPVPVEVAADLRSLRTQVSGCTRCELHQSRTQTVFGSGDESARLLVIGEAPGADEDAQGEPFVGRAGTLLNAMLLGIGLAREQVYVANILKCRPPRNRDPQATEVASCTSYLQQQIALVAPELILAVGRIAAQNLLNVATPIGKLRGSTHTHAASGLPVLVTYHPAYLLRSPVEKRRAWQDLKRVAARLGLAP
ncbi:MAG: uracil-DNA glycosylase family 4 [Gammaproteobacteria bacterium]|jgi:uracil-DNA glycosylase family 4